MQKTQIRSQGRKEEGATKSDAKKKGSIFFPTKTNVIDELKNMKALTPYSVASRLDLRLSVAKQFLKSLEKQGTVEYVSGSKNIKIYKFRDA